MRKWLALLLAALTTTGLLVVKVNEWRYVQEGYRLKIGEVGGPFSEYAIQFPLWRSLAVYGVALVILAGVGLAMAGRSLAAVVLGVALAATVAIGACDVSQYGTIGSPTSLTSVGLLLLLLMTVQYMKKAGLLR